MRDRDLGTLRHEMDQDPTWASLMKQLHEADAKKPLMVKVPSERQGSVTAPEDPWPAFVPIALWLVLTTGFIVLFVRSLTNDAYWLFVIVAAIGMLCSAAFFAHVIDKRIVRDRRRRSADRTPEQEPEDRPPGTEPSN